jgi:hypothetical protein
MHDETNIKNYNINSQGAENSVVFFSVCRENMNFHVGFRVKVRLTVLNVKFTWTRTYSANYYVSL